MPRCVEIRQVVTTPDGKAANNVLHGSYTTTAPNIQNLANSLFTALSSLWSTQLGTFMHPGTTLVRVECRDMALHTNPVFISSGSGVVGTSPDPALPGEMAAVITENALARGRGLKGRIYLGGFSENANAGNGIIAPAAKLALDNYATGLFTAISGAGLTPCIAQPPRVQYIGYTGTLHPARTPGGPMGVTSYTCRDNHWDSQRRRGLK